MSIEPTLLTTTEKIHLKSAGLTVEPWTSTLDLPSVDENESPIGQKKTLSSKLVTSAAGILTTPDMEDGLLLVKVHNMLLLGVRREQAGASALDGQIRTVKKVLRTARRTRQRIMKMRSLRSWRP